VTDPLNAARRHFNPDITVATVVCQAQRFLVVEETVHGRLLINQPAGHLEAGESLLQAAVRETLEESGWDVDLDAYLGTYLWTSPGGRTFLRFAFVGHCLRHHPERTLDQGVERALWLRRDELAAVGERLRSPLVLRAVDDYLGGQRHPLDALHQVTA